MSHSHLPHSSLHFGRFERIANTDSALAAVYRLKALVMPPSPAAIRPRIIPATLWNSCTVYFSTSKPQCGAAAADCRLANAVVDGQAKRTPRHSLTVPEENNDADFGRGLKSRGGRHISVRHLLAADAL